jgi:TetR/AcrR family transcriptional regulator
MDVSLAALAQAERDEAGPPEKLRKLLRLHIAGILEEAYGAVLLTDLEDLTPAQRLQYVALRDRFEAGIRKILADGMESGVFRQADLRVATFAILGAINWIPKWYQSGGTWSAQDAAEKFALFFLESVLA